MTRWKDNSKQYMKEYREKHKNKINQQTKDWLIENRGRRNKWEKVYRQKNKRKKRLVNKKWYQKNRENIKQYNRIWAIKNPKKRKEYAKNDKLKHPLHIKARQYAHNHKFKRLYCLIHLLEGKYMVATIFHHTDYETNMGFSVCLIHHKRVDKWL